MVTVFVFRRVAGQGSPLAINGERGPRVEFLQLRRAKEPHRGTWQTVMGGIEQAETALQTARRELREETGLDPASPACVGFWALDQIFPFYRPAADVVILSPTFAVEIAPTWEPVLNPENDDLRWVPEPAIDEAFGWPGHVAACRQIVESLLRPGSVSEPLLRVDRR
jgi:dATP pyrophosphohydrolase